MCVVSIGVIINKKGNPRYLESQHLTSSLCNFNVGTIGALKQTARADGSVGTTSLQAGRPTNPGSIFSKDRRFI
jgi:hypothetical protein